MSKTTIFRFALLSLCLAATFVGIPAPQAEAADCGAPWGYYGCCYLSGGRVTMKQYQVCCNNGNCTTNYRCTGSACPV